LPNSTTSPALRFLQSIDSSWKGHELFALWIIKQLKPKVTVDIGFDKGLSTIAFALSNRGATYGIDWFYDHNLSRKKIAMDIAYQNILMAIRLHYVKNIHLIVGPSVEITRQWKREIDLLHIDGMQRYSEAKEQYDHWKPFLTKNAVLMIHDVTALPNETGKFFHDLPMPKIVFPHGKGLGIATQNQTIYRQISEEWQHSLQPLNLPS